MRELKSLNISSFIGKGWRRVCRAPLTSKELCPSYQQDHSRFSRILFLIFMYNLNNGFGIPYTTFEKISYLKGFNWCIRLWTNAKYLAAT